MFLKRKVCTQKGSGCYRSHRYCFYIIHTRSITNVTLLQSYFLRGYLLCRHTCREYFSSVARMPPSHMQANVHAHAHTHTRTYIHTHMHTRTHAHTHKSGQILHSKKIIVEINNAYGLKMRLGEKTIV